MNLSLRVAENDLGMARIDVVDQRADTSTVLDMTPNGLREIDATIQGGAEEEELCRQRQGLAKKGAIAEEEGSYVVQIGRTLLFDPVQFMNDPRLTIEEEDERSTALEGIDLWGVSLESMVQGDVVIRGEVVFHPCPGNH